MKRVLNLNDWNEAINEAKKLMAASEVDEKINMDDINDSYGFWGTIESGGIKLARRVENLFFEAIYGLKRNYKLSEEEALKVLNSKMGRKAADQIIDGQADSGLLGLEQYYGKSLKKEMDRVLAMDEARDLNDPVLLRMRAAMAKRDAAKNAPKEPAKKEMSPAKAAKLRKLQAERAEIMRDMEQEAEPEGGPIADRYGKMLNKIDKEIAKLGGLRESEDVNERMPEPRKDEYYFSVRHSDAKDVWKMADDEFGNDIDRGRIEVLFQKNKYVIKDFELARSFYQYLRDRGVKFFDQNFVSESVEVNEARSINKIKKEWDTVTNDMKETVKEWKAADASKKESYLEKLKSLTAKKKELEKELDKAVKGKDRNAELAASESLLEGGMSEIDIIAQNARNFKEFMKEVIADFKLEDTKELRNWLETIYAPYK